MIKHAKSIRLFLSVLAVCCCLLSASRVRAEIRAIPELSSRDLSAMVRDEIRDRIYVADSANNKIYVVDMNKETVIKTITMPGSVKDMAMSKNNTWLGVISNNQISRVNLNSYYVSPSVTPVVVNDLGSKNITGTLLSLAFDQYEGMFVFVANEIKNAGWIYSLQADAKTVIRKFGTGELLNLPVYNGFLRTDLTGTALYVAQQGLSPGSMMKFDVKQRANPKFLKQSEYGTIGGNIQDFEISPRHNEVYVTAGGSYELLILDSDTLEVEKESNLSMEAYSKGVDVTRYGDKVYAISGTVYEDYLYQFDIANREQTNIFNLSFSETGGSLNRESQARGIAIDRFGEKAFVIIKDSSSSTPAAQTKAKVYVVDVNKDASIN